MACPKCGMAMALRERICPRCKYFPKGDRFVSVTPPRLSRPERGGPSEGRGGPDVISMGARVRLQAPRFRFPRLRTAMVYAAAIVPGGAHLLLRRWWRGFIFLGLVGGTLAASIYSFEGIYGQGLFGVAASIHACSILNLTSYKYHPGIVERMLVMALILAGLVIFVYGPVFLILAERLIGRQEMGLLGLMSLLLATAIFNFTISGMSFAVSRALHALTSSGGPGREY